MSEALGATKNKKRVRPAHEPKTFLSFKDPKGMLRERIHAVLGKDADISVGEFVRIAIEDRLHDIEEANRNVLVEQAKRIRISGTPVKVDLDRLAIERVQRAISGNV